jgi:ZIP family zinc transporter
MSGIWQAGFWGFVGGVSLLIGAVVGVYGRASQRVIAWVMAVGAGGAHLLRRVRADE